MQSTSANPSAAHPALKNPNTYKLATASTDFFLKDLVAMRGFETELELSPLQRRGANLLDVVGSNAINLRNTFAIDVKLEAITKNDDALGVAFDELHDFALSATHFGKGGYYYRVKIVRVIPDLTLGALRGATSLNVTLEGYRIYPYAAFGKVTTEAAYNVAVKRKALIGTLSAQGNKLDYNPDTLPNGAIGQAYNQVISVTNASFPDGSQGTITVNRLPNGLSLTDSGNGQVTLSGTPTEGGEFVFGLSIWGATSSNVVETTQLFTLTIGTSSSLAITLPNGVQTSADVFEFERASNPSADDGFFLARITNFTSQGFDPSSFLVITSPSFPVAATYLGSDTFRIPFDSQLALGSYTFTATVQHAGETINKQWTLTMVETQTAQPYQGAAAFFKFDEETS